MGICCNGRLFFFFIIIDDDLNRTCHSLRTRRWWWFYIPHSSHISLINLIARPALIKIHYSFHCFCITFIIKRIHMFIYVHQAQFVQFGSAWKTFNKFETNQFDQWKKNMNVYNWRLFALHFFIIMFWLFNFFCSKSSNREH